jgi:hypothetical protein
MGFRDKCNRVIIDFYVADKKKHELIVKEKDKIDGWTHQPPTHLTETVEDHNEQLPEKLTDRFQSRQGSDRKRFERSFRSHVVRTSSARG